MKRRYSFSFFSIIWFCWYIQLNVNQLMEGMENALTSENINRKKLNKSINKIKI